MSRSSDPVADADIPSRAELARLIADMKAELEKPPMTAKEEYDFLYNPDSEDRAAFDRLSRKIKTGLAHHKRHEPDFDPEL